MGPGLVVNFQCALASRFTSSGLSFILCKVVLLGHTACVIPGLPPLLLSFPLGIPISSLSWGWAGGIPKQSSWLAYWLRGVGGVRG